MTSQIDRLDPVDRTVLRYAAVLGFVVHDLELQDLLTAQFGTGSESDLGQRLPLLDEFLTRSSPGRLRFRNALMRDVAYEGLPYRRRQVLHDQVGQRLEAAAPDPREQSELLSLHFFQAGRFERAWRYSRVAGMRARSKYANTEAVAFFTRAVRGGPARPRRPAARAGRGPRGVGRPALHRRVLRRRGPPTGRPGSSGPTMRCRSPRSC